VVVSALFCPGKLVSFCIWKLKGYGGFGIGLRCQKKAACQSIIASATVAGWKATIARDRDFRGIFAELFTCFRLPAVISLFVRVMRHTEGSPTPAGELPAVRVFYPYDLP